MLIFIVGYMGSGKSTFGQQLAERLNYRFLDMDDMIEVSTGYHIIDFFAKYGEKAFREKEREILQACFGMHDAVIAAGGGTPCYYDNLAQMNSEGLTIFLDTKLETILERLSGKTLHRPLLKGVSKEQLPVFIREHLESRKEFYSRARLRTTGEADELEELLKVIRQHHAL
jgi:shikimate kinase